MTEDSKSGEVDERSEIGPRYGAMSAEAEKKLKEDAQGLADRLVDEDAVNGPSTNGGHPVDDDRVKDDADAKRAEIIERSKEGSEARIAAFEDDKPRVKEFIEIGDVTINVEEKVRDFTIEDGFKIDEKTGEILGLVSEPGNEIEDAKMLESIIQRFFNVESAKASLEAQRDAISANLNAMIKDQTQRLAYLEMCFFPQFGDYLRAHLKRKKDGSYARKSIPTAYGKIQLRELPGSMEVDDTAKAVAFLRRYQCEEAIKVTESVLKSKIPDMIRGIIEADTKGTVVSDSGLRLIPKSEKVKIDAKPKA